MEPKWDNTRSVRGRLTSQNPRILQTGKGGDVEGPPSVPFPARKTEGEIEFYYLLAREQL